MDRAPAYRILSLALVVLLLVAGAFYLFGSAADNAESQIQLSSSSEDPPGIETYQQLCAAKELAADGQHAEALASFEKIVTTSDNASYRWDAEIQAAVSMAALERHDDALNRLERIIRECPLADETGFAKMAKADVLSQAGRHEQAVALFEETIAARAQDHPWMSEESLLGLVRLARRQEKYGLERATLTRLIYDFPGVEDNRRRSAEGETRKLDERMAAVQRQAIEQWQGKRLDDLGPGEILLKASDGPYLVSAPLTIGPGGVLRIEPGTRIRFAAAGCIRTQGRLIAAGTPDRPIELLPLSDSPAKDYWLGLEVSGSTAAAELTNCRISGADPGVRVTGGLLVLQNCALEHCVRAGIRAEENARISLNGLSITNAMRAGIECQTGASVEASDLALRDIKTHGLSLFRSGKSTLTRCTWENCGSDGLSLRGAVDVNLEECRILRSSGNGVAAIEESSLALVRSKVQQNAEAGLRMQDRCRAVVENSTISENKGPGLSADARCSGEIRRNRIEGNGQAGVILSMDSAPSITLNSIIRNKGPGVLLRASVPQALRSNDLSGNAEAALRNEGPGKVDARENWWGSTAEAEITGAVQDRSDKDDWGEVEVKPWMQERPRDL